MNSETRGRFVHLSPTKIRPLVYIDAHKKTVILRTKSNCFITEILFIFGSCILILILI